MAKYIETPKTAEAPPKTPSRTPKNTHTNTHTHTHSAHKHKHKQTKQIPVIVEPSIQIGDSRVAFRLCFKTSPSAKPFHMEISFIHM